MWRFSLVLIFAGISLNAANKPKSYEELCSTYLKIINKKTYEIDIFDNWGMSSTVRRLKSEYGDKMIVENLGVEGGYVYPYLTTKHTRKPKHKVFIMAGQHGYESLSTLSTLRWFEGQLKNDFFDKEGVQVVIVPMANPWGADHVRRKDRHGKDPNRQFLPDSEYHLKLWTDELIKEYGPFDLSLDIHGTIFKKGIFVVQNGENPDFASRALAALPQDILAKSDDDTYPGYRGIKDDPKKYTMYVPGLSTSENKGTHKEYMESSGAAKRAFTVEYSDKVDPEQKLVALETLMQAFVQTMQSVD